MKRLILIGLALFASIGFAQAQNTTKLCISTNGSNCVPIDASNPLPTTAGAVAASTNLTEILGNPISLTNPLFVAPSTGATFTIGPIPAGANAIGSVGVTSIVPGTTATSLGKAEDAIAVSGDTGVFALGVRRDTLTTSAANGDYSEIATDTFGSVQTRNFEKQALSYAASGSAVLAASATDIFTITGSATKTVYITKVRISAAQTTGGLIFTTILKRSTANTGGTSSAVTAVPLDSSDGAATASVVSYTANPSTGALIGAVASAYVAAPAPATANNIISEFKFGEVSKPIILRGVTQQLSVNLNGNTFVGGAFIISIEWYEI